MKSSRTAKETVLRFPVQDIYDIDNEKVLVGRVASGKIVAGQDVIFHPCGKSANIAQVKKYEEQVEVAQAGESIGLVLKDNKALKAVRRGEIICPVENSPNVSNTIIATVFWMSGQPLQKNETYYFKCSTQQVTCKVKKISDRINSSSLDLIAENSDELRETEVARLTLKMDDYVVTDPFDTIAEMGRFVLMRDTETVAGGVLH